MTKTTSAVVALLAFDQVPEKKKKGRKRGPQLRIGVSICLVVIIYRFRIRMIDILRLLNKFQFEERSDFLICID